MNASYLLDVNVLVSIIYSGHEHHERAASWFTQVMDREHATWLSCPTTENGAIRLLGKSSICSPPYAAVKVMDDLLALADVFPHQFIPEVFSLGRDPQVDLTRVTSSSQVTDLALLSLAQRHGAFFATMDWRINPVAVVGGQDAYLIIP